MENYQKSRVELTNTQLNKLKSAAQKQDRNNVKNK